jgi:dTMP kinase
LFITFEGTEGSGKSWQAHALVERLRARGLSVVETREPGGTPLGDQVRQLVLMREDLNLAPRSEALLMNAARAQVVEQVIWPALARGDVVVCDRFADSTRAYQGAGRGIDVQSLNSVISFATADLEPDMTMLLDLPVEIGLARKQTHPGWNRFEAETLAFHERVRAAYRAMARNDQQRWHCFDASLPPDELADKLWAVVARQMGLEP